MGEFHDFFNRKFYSKVGRACHATSKPNYFSKELTEKRELTMEFVQSELVKVKTEIERLKRKKKKVPNSSSFLATTRDSYMKAFVRST